MKHFAILFNNRFYWTVFVTTLGLSSFSCLKTRAQIRGDDESNYSKPTKVKIEDAQPSGGYALDEIKSELVRQTGRIEDLERSTKQQQSAPDRASKDELKKLETRIIELEQAQSSMLEAIKKVQDRMPVPESPEVFDKAKKEYENSDYSPAIENFTQYLRAPKPKHLEEATFLRAESYYALKQYKKAIVDYSKFPESFNKSKRMPVALYRIGQSFDALGSREDAKAFYQLLLDKYPKASESKKARAKLR